MSKSVRFSKGGLIVLILVVIGLTLGATVATYSLTDNFETNIFVNQDNLIHTIDEYETKTGTSGDGISWSVDSFGRVKANGEITSDAETVEFVLGTIEIEEEDFYTLSGAPEGSINTFYIKAKYTTESGSEVILYSDFANYCTSPTEITKGTEVTFSIVIHSGVEMDNYAFSPTFVAGEEAGKF